MKTIFHVFKGTIWANMSYWRKSLHLTFSEPQWKTLNFMGNSTSFCRVVVKTINHLSWKTISPQLVFVKFDFLTFSKNELKKLLMLRKCFSGSLFKSVHYVTRGTFWQKTRFWGKNFWNHSYRLSCLLETFQASLFDQLLKLHCTCLEVLTKFFYLKNVLPNQFRNIEWTFSAFPRNLRRDHQNCAPYLQMIFLRTVYKI